MAMGKCIIKIVDDGRPFYLIWSTVVDAPITRGMSLEELDELIREENGQEGLRELPARLARCDAKGVSDMTHPGSVEDYVSFNRAGRGETCLSLEQLTDFYCRKGATGERPVGRVWEGDDA